MLQMSEPFARVLEIVRRACGTEKRLTCEEHRHRRELSEGIIEYARMIQKHYRYAEEVMVEIPELAWHFRETPHVVRQALALLSEDGCAKDVKDGCWKVKPDGAAGDSRSDEGAA
jgi:hypothetical protein